MAEAVQLRFVRAAGRAPIEELDRLIGRGAEVNGSNRAGETALLSAIAGFVGSYEGYLRVQYLLDRAADPNLKGQGFPSGPTLPLHSAVWATNALFTSSRSEDRFSAELLVRALLKAGAFVSGVDDDGKTPLHIAAELNAVPVATILLESGAKVMPRDKGGKTPLDYAESAVMIRLLKEHGATEG
jgi:ankyrin repeat protein